MGKLVGLCCAQLPSSLVSGFRVANRGRSPSIRCDCAGSRGTHGPDWMSQPSASPYQVLGLDPVHCSLADIRAAFRARVKEFHPDVYKNSKMADILIRRVIKAYEVLSASKEGVNDNGTCRDPFEEPECEACDIFVNETLCIGKGCPYSCVKRAPHAFSFNNETGTARATSQGHGDDYQVQLSVGQCPRSCIYYVTPSQRVILEDLLERVLLMPYDLGEAALLDSLISTAYYENKRYRGPMSTF
ncbi:chaperone DnaJ-domain superfamily protein isoform X2 [Carex rostrata]